MLFERVINEYRRVAMIFLSYQLIENSSLYVSLLKLSKHFRINVDFFLKFFSSKQNIPKIDRLTNQVYKQNFCLCYI